MDLVEHNEPMLEGNAGMRAVTKTREDTSHPGNILSLVDDLAALQT